MADRDYYGTLGVARTATAEEIKQAYRKLAMRFHPDRNPGDPTAEARFKEVSEAYHVLSDVDRRAHYDRFGKMAPTGASGMPDVVDMTAMFEQVLGDLFGSFAPFAGAKKVGRDVKVDVELTLTEAARGVEKPVTFSREASCSRCSGRGGEPGTPSDACPACAGKGEVRFQQGPLRFNRACGKCDGRGSIPRSPCTACKGTGIAKKSEKLTITLPAGVEEGATRTVRNYGDVSRATGAAGDLEITVRIAQHPLFTRDGADLFCTMPVSFPQAALGSPVEVPTLDGRVKMRLPPGTQPGHQLRLRGKGMPKAGGAGHGDQLVTIQLEVPAALNDEQRSIVEQLGHSMHDSLSPQRKTFIEKLRDLFG